MANIADINGERNPLPTIIDAVNSEGLPLAVKSARDRAVKIILHREPPFWFSFQSTRLGRKNQQGGENNAGED
nr:MAG TPA: hypothetical protein [Caudoviricetes sp.]